MVINVIETEGGATIIMKEEDYNKIMEYVEKGYVTKSTIMEGKLFITFEEQWG